MNVWNQLVPPLSRYNGTKTTYLLLWLLLLSGLVLSVLSGLKICSQMCSETAKYSLFGIDFGWFGTGFFSLMILILLLRRYIPAIGVILFISIWAAVGAEMRLIWIQKFDIGTWCPVCLCIAVVLIITTLVVSYESLADRTTFGGAMKVKFIHFTVILIVVLIGFGGALVGVQKEAGAAELDIYFGKRKSDTTVYFVSDWFCPLCRKIEPDIEKMFTELSATVRVAFVDLPIHPESANITPYHLQFMLYEKDKYIALRHALDTISRSTKNPTQDQVQTAVAPLGGTLRPLNFMEILNGVRQFETICKRFNVTATPSVVIDNTRTRKRKQLVGSDEITRSAIITAIAAVEK